MPRHDSTEKRPLCSESISLRTELQSSPHLKYAPEEKTITAKMLEDLCKTTPDALKAPKNKSCFWYDCSITDVREKLKGKHPEHLAYAPFWKPREAQVKAILDVAPKDLAVVRMTDENNKLMGEDASHIIAESMGLYPLRTLVNFIDGGAKMVADGDNNPFGPWGVASRIFAENAEGIVFVISGNRGIKQDCIWATTELPALMKNPKVDMILEIDSINPDIIKSVRFTKPVDKDVLAQVDLPLPVNILPIDVRKHFATLNYVTGKQIYQKLPEYINTINIDPCIIKYNKDGTIESKRLDSNGHELKTESYKDLQSSIMGTTTKTSAASTVSKEIRTASAAKEGK